MDTGLCISETDLRHTLDDAAERLPTGRKEAQLLEAARSVFLEQGYAGAGVDDIVHRAGISKATLYKYFPDKALLFRAVVDQVCLEQRERLKEVTFNLPTVEALEAAAELAVTFMTTPIAQSVFRTCVAEAGRFPHVGHAFYLSGPVAMSDQLVAMFERAEADGDLVIDDKRLAANQLWQLARSVYFYEMLFQVRSSVSEDEKKRIVAETVAMFVARYGTETLRAQVAQNGAQRSA
ncbi:MAG: TetR/AcrR family transcriptional regulator [Devosiaceae bacterium]|nr:TetR/AcrR family transcriptional regulator [Devosiaceae bacterium MH13]